MNTQSYLQVMQGIAMTAYGVDIQSKEPKSFTNPLDFDAHDLWLGSDFDYFLDNMLDDLFDEIESDLKSVWSTNKSEQESAQYSAQRSADFSAMGMTDDGAVSGDDLSGFTVDTVESAGASANATQSFTSSEASEQSLDHDLSDHSGFKHKGHFHHPLESRYSGTQSENLDGDTQGSHSHGTSDTQNDGKASTVSTQSIVLEQYREFYANDSDSEEVKIRDAVDPGKTRSNRTTAAPGGIEWIGDNDAEYIFGTSWLDILKGGYGDDLLYGFEGDDILEGGYGDDKLFGDAGDDILYANLETNLGNSSGDSSEVNLLSGGTGNDKLYGGLGGDVLFGGPGHDLLYGGYGDSDDQPATQLHGEDGDDEIWASYYGNSEIWGGAGDDLILSGVTEAGGLTQEAFPRLPRRSRFVAVGDTPYKEEYVSYGNNDIDGGDGNDYIIGGQEDNDIFGGRGDDVIYGFQPSKGDVSLSFSYVPNVEIDGGEGDDTIFGVAVEQEMILRGGLGNDTIHAGGYCPSDDSDYGCLEYDTDYDDQRIYIYGDEGHDKIFGGDLVPFQYLFGGSGDDYIKQGYQNSGSGGNGLFYVDAGSGDDIISVESFGSDYGVDQIVRAGKGDDKINVYMDSDLDLYDSDGVVNTGVYQGRLGSAYNGSLTYDGGEGDDEIWAFQDWQDSGGDLMRLYGGNGNDIIKHGYGIEGGLLMAGQGDKDLIDTQWLDSNPSFKGETLINDNATYGDLVIFGDWGYGPEDNRYGVATDTNTINQTLMYGDPRLEEQLWGDDDTILIGYGDLSLGPKAIVYAGDGDDLVDIHGDWSGYEIYGGRGNDTFNVDGGWSGTGDYGMVISGGLGDDIFTQGEESTALNAAGTKNLSDQTTLYGGEGNDKFGLFTGTGSGSQNIDIVAGAGNDKISGAVGFLAANIDAGAGDDIVYDVEEDYGAAVRDITLGDGDDVFFGGSGGMVEVEGGAGNDKIFGPSDGEYGHDVVLEGDAGDDIIDHGDNNYGDYGYGGDGNDKIIGGMATHYGRYYGNAGDDKIWMINPEQRGLEIEPVYGWYGYGGPGNDHMYGSDIGEILVGDDGSLTANDGLHLDYGGAPHADYFNETDPGDDVIFGYGGSDNIFGQAGDDVLDGGESSDLVVGGRGDDKIFGGEGADFLYGDERTSDSHDTGSDTSSDDDLVLFGDDKMYGGAGDDTMFGSFGDDFMKGGDDDDTMWGGAGEDTIYGDAGVDTINAGYGWDTVFGGDGCDVIEVIDGGDVVWLGDCDGSATQKLTIDGTGDNPENFVVVMDFWLESAKPFNEICLHVGENQDNPSAPRCKSETGNLNSNTNRENNDGICVDATEIADPEQLYNEIDDRALGGGEWRGPGCKHDGGPLWISIPIADDPVVAQETQQRAVNTYWNVANSGHYFENDGGNTYAMTIWARFFQRAHKQPVIDRKKPRITTYNNPERYEYSSRYESQGRDLAGGSEDQLSPGGYGYGYGGGNNYYRPPQDNSQGYFPRISHRGSWSQTESVSHNDEELVECLRIWLCDTETTQYTCYNGSGAAQGSWNDCGRYTSDFDS